MKEKEEQNTGKKKKKKKEEEITNTFKVQAVNHKQTLPSLPCEQRTETCKLWASEKIGVR